MSLENFWQYLVDNGWRLPTFPEDDEGNFFCPLCGQTIKRVVKMDEVPVYERVINCPVCGEVESRDEEEIA